MYDYEFSILEDLKSISRNFCHFQMENCASPAIVTKDLAMLVYGRDGRLGPRLKHLFQGTFRNPEANRLTGIYEVVLKKATLGSPGILWHSFLSLYFRLSYFCSYIFPFRHFFVQFRIFFLLLSLCLLSLSIAYLFHFFFWSQTLAKKKVNVNKPMIF